MVKGRYTPPTLMETFNGKAIVSLRGSPLASIPATCRGVWLTLVSVETTPI